MRLFVLSTPLLLASTTFARSPLRRGQATDTCANLNADLVFPDVFIDDKPYDAGRIHIGLCISQVETFVGHYNVTEAAAKVVGVDKVESTVTAMIKKVGVQCSYPPHAMPAVTSSNECDFVCTDGFSAMPTNHPSSCYCPPYLKECDGQCGHSDCSTTPPPSRRQNEPKCGKDLTMCGVPDATSGEAYKCTDVTSDSYTCGGCVKASPFGSPSTNGVNCHEIPNVDGPGVSCKDSKCFVHSCKSGFTVSASNDGCVAMKTTRSVHAVAREESSDRIVPGSVVGDKVPRTHATSGVTHTSGEMLSTGKGPQSNVPDDVPRDARIPRSFAP